jgi:hypothetical protein
VELTLVLFTVLLPVLTYAGFTTITPLESFIPLLLLGGLNILLLTGNLLCLCWCRCCCLECREPELAITSGSSVSVV